MPRTALALLCVAACCAPASPALALDETRADVAAFIAEMAGKHGFDAAELSRTLAQVESRPPIIEAISRPAEKVMPWHEYRARFLTERRIRRGAEVSRAEADALGRAAALGVPAQVMLAIVGVETFFGENVGKHRVADALATLAFDYPPRSPFFRGELENYLLMAREESLDPLVPVGSYAGAMGIPQFMPSSFRNFAVDGDGDGRRNLWTSWPDVFSSVANYLKRHGWRTGEPTMSAADVSAADLEGLEFGKLDLRETVGSLRARGVRFDTVLPEDAPAVLVQLTGVAGPEYRVGYTNFHAITRYNRSQLYASAVNDLAEAIAAEAMIAAGPPSAGPRPFESISTPGP